MTIPLPGGRRARVVVPAGAKAGTVLKVKAPKAAPAEALDDLEEGGEEEDRKSVSRGSRRTAPRRHLVRKISKR